MQVGGDECSDLDHNGSSNGSEKSLDSGYIPKVEPRVDCWTGCDMWKRGVDDAFFFFFLYSGNI